MKINTENLKLSGKGAVISGEILHENIKLIMNQLEIHELVGGADDQTTRVGWIIPGQFEILADFTAHSDSGMRGESTHDLVEKTLVLDNETILAELIPEELQEMDITASQDILNTMLGTQFKGKINLDHHDKDEGLIMVSTASGLVFVQTDTTSVRIKEDVGIFVLERKESGDKLIIIDEDNGINIMGDKSIRIGEDGIYFNDELFDVGSIIGEVATSVGHSMAKLSSSLAKSFGRNFGKNFGKNFDFNFDFDDDFDDAFDVDIE